MRPPLLNALLFAALLSACEHSDSLPLNPKTPPVAQSHGASSSLVANELALDRRHLQGDDPNSLFKSIPVCPGNSVLDFNGKAFLCQPTNMVGRSFAAPSSELWSVHLDGVKGNDTNDGGSHAKAVKTVERAWGLVLAGLQNSDRFAQYKRVILVVWPGSTYFTDYKNTPADKIPFYLKTANLTKPLSILGQSNPEGERPVFDGSKETNPTLHSIWLTVNTGIDSYGKDTNLSISGLQVQNYGIAVLLSGDRQNRDSGFNAYTTIFNNVFSHIGWEHSTAAIDLFNSRKNRIFSNKFQHIRTNPKLTLPGHSDECGGLHAIYAAHFSSDNLIYHNTFDDACGSVIKFRDRSNNNLVRENTFSNLASDMGANVPAIEEWFCDREAAKNVCTKGAIAKRDAQGNMLSPLQIIGYRDGQGECPSTNNVIFHNVMVGGPLVITIAGGTQYFADEAGQKGRNAVSRAWCAVEDYYYNDAKTKMPRLLDLSGPHVLGYYGSP